MRTIGLTVSQSVGFTSDVIGLIWLKINMMQTGFVNRLFAGNMKADWIGSVYDT